MSYCLTVPIKSKQIKSFCPLFKSLLRRKNEIVTKYEHASVNSNCALPPLPPRAFACLGGPGGGAFASLARPGAGLANLGGTPRAFDTHVVYSSKTWRIFVVKISALWRIGQQGLEKNVHVFKGMPSEF